MSKKLEKSQQHSQLVGSCSFAASLQLFQCYIAGIASFVCFDLSLLMDNSFAKDDIKPGPIASSQIVAQERALIQRVG